MSIKLCCLCFSQSCEFTLLQSELGETNKAYEITVTYFDPMLLTGGKNSQLVNENKVLCQACWCHIEDFHEFQQMIIASRSQLENNRLCTMKVTRDEELVTLDTEYKQAFTDIDGDVLLDDLLLINEHENEEPLTELMTSEAINNIEENLSYGKNEKIESNLKQQETSQCGKLKGFIKQNTATESTNSDENEFSNKKTKTKECISPEIPKKIATINYRDICEESDYFISQWKAQLECDLCQESYPNFETLRKHFIEKHKRKCYVKCCEREFYHRYFLVKHIKQHINTTIHKCDICDKTFYKHSNVISHMRVIHGSIENLECNVCHKIFKWKGTLNRHLREHVEIHTGLVLYQCAYCPQTFKVNSMLFHHRKKVHPKEEWEEARRGRLQIPKANI